MCANEWWPNGFTAMEQLPNQNKHLSTLHKTFYSTGQIHISKNQQTQSVFHTAFSQTQLILAYITALPADPLKSFGSVPQSKFISYLSKEQPAVRGQLFPICFGI